MRNATHYLKMADKLFNFLYNVYKKDFGWCERHNSQVGMKQKELTKAFMMISNWDIKFWFLGLHTNIWAV